ncbi:hypothetical protein KRR38_32445 [Novosphingobium sp. G106]|uniref:hypothetical protein n=1 Tax=Novosphingobium sp. G106 TaxID=2849500 RepID=UPI001C2D5287|nr:hypothetical protein [Novosphingobium sp. G106]MBV1692247.1 hypothetical protein [Novosphingobium sp. G106]
MKPSEGRGAAAAYWIVTVWAWCALNGLAALGLLALFFILFANASFEGFFREGCNLAEHYLAASPAARASFQHIIAWLFAGAFVPLAAMRARALAADLRASAATRPSNPTVTAT